MYSELTTTQLTQVVNAYITQLIIKQPTFVNVLQNMDITQQKMLVKRVKIPIVLIAQTTRQNARFAISHTTLTQQINAKVAQVHAETVQVKVLVWIVS